MAHRETKGIHTRMGRMVRALKLGSLGEVSRGTVQWEFLCPLHVRVT